MPKCRTIQIVWHGKEPVYSLDFHPDGTLATAGADKEIKLWKVGETVAIVWFQKFELPIRVLHVLVESYGEHFGLIVCDDIIFTYITSIVSFSRNIGL